MKRGGPLRRTTALPRYRSHIRSVSSKRAAKAGEYAHLRALVHAREGGCCARCRTLTPITVGEAHHRRLRSQGGRDDPWTCVWLCASCHRWAHGNVAAAREAGWIVPGWADPASWPCLLADGHYYQPSDTGWTPAEPREEQTA